MTRPVILATGPYPADEIERLEAHYDVVHYWDAADKPAALRSHASAIRAISARADLPIPPEVIQGLPKLELIAVYGVGVDSVDFAVCRARGIKVTNTPDVLSNETADAALALMLAVARQVPKGDHHVRSGAWAETGNMPFGIRMYGKRIGIVGLGRIGKAVAKRALAFDMTVAYHGRNPQPDQPFAYFATVTELAAQSDFLVATLTGGPSTVKAITAEALAALGPKGVFINVARGTVVDEAALLDALERKAILGAGLDVFWNEPRVDPRFFKLDNTVLLPHIGSATGETRQAMGQLMRDNLAAFFAGRPLLTPVL